MYLLQKTKKTNKKPQTSKQTNKKQHTKKNLIKNNKKTVQNCRSDANIKKNEIGCIGKCFFDI